MTLDEASMQIRDEAGDDPLVVVREDLGHHFGRHNFGV
jgi:hypothetical protein